MMISTLGVYSSGSTWVFNVVRRLLKQRGGKVFSMFTEEGHDLLSYNNINMDVIVTKSHHFDLDFIRILGISSSKIIISVRDPRDCVVSLMQRFSLNDSDAISRVSRSSSVVAMVKNQLKNLTFFYEDAYFSNEQTIANIAEFLEIKISSEVIKDIYSEYQRENMSCVIKGRFKDSISNMDYDNDTHWHPGHIGDGKVGKWKDVLSNCAAQSIYDAIHPLCYQEFKAGCSLIWSAYFFKYTDDRSLDDGNVIETGMDSQLRIYGPYLYLPAGRWRIDFRFRAMEPAHQSMLMIEAILGYGKAVLGVSSARLSGAQEQCFGFEFEHMEFFHPIEARIHAMNYGSLSKVEFLGVTLTYMACPIRHNGKATAIVI